LTSLRHSELLLEKGIDVVQNHFGQIDESSKGLYIDDTVDMYMVEEFFYAALDVKQIEWAKLFLKIVAKHFAGSVKQMRMLGMYYEAG